MLTYVKVLKKTAFDHKVQVNSVQFLIRGKFIMLSVNILCLFMH